MRMFISATVVLLLIGGCAQPRFAHTGGSENPYVMFDGETAQACYSGSVTALDERIQAIRRQGDADASLSTPSGLLAYYFPASKGSFVPALFVEATRQSLEFSGKAEERYREAERLAELRQLPTCRSLLKGSAAP